MVKVWELIINEEGESILDFAMSFYLAIQNTFFTKRTYRTYKSGDRESQIDFLLYRRSMIREVEDCKTLLGECVGKQHAPVIMKIAMRTQTSQIETGEPRIKWWKLADEKVEHDFRNRVLSSIGEVEELEEIEDWWIAIREIFRKSGDDV